MYIFPKGGQCPALTILYLKDLLNLYVFNKHADFVIRCYTTYYVYSGGVQYNWQLLKLFP